MSLDPLARAVSLHREEVSAGLDFRLPFVPLLDQQHCVSWQAELEQHGRHWEVRSATPDLGDMLPTAGGLYMFVWRPSFEFRMAAPRPAGSFGWILYVGLAGAGTSKNTFQSRYKGEYRKYLAGDPEVLFVDGDSDKREQRLGRYLVLRPLEYWWLEVPDSDQIARLERKLIQLFSPPLNKQHRVLRKVAARPAF